MTNARIVSRARVWLAVAALGCSPAVPANPPVTSPASGAGGGHAPASPASPAPVPVITASPAPGAGGETAGAAGAGRAASAAPASAPAGPLACVAAPDPELDRESPWSKAVGERFERELSKLARCTNELPPDEMANVTLRFIYAGDGSPRSRHIVAAKSAGCAAAECIQSALASVRAPKLSIEQGAFDLPLALERGSVPRRTADERAGLAEDADADDPASCVDPSALRLARSSVDEVVGSTFPQLESCYSHAIARDHQASGTVTFEFIIGLEGEVALAQARDTTLYDCEAVECMLAPLRQLRFPPPLGRSVRVIYPIRYSIEQPSVQLR